MNSEHLIHHGRSPTIRRVMFIVALFVLITLLLAGMIYLEGKVFDGVRSYVRGEGLWAKAQKDAVLYLERYSYNHLDTDYAAFEQSLQVNAGDKTARLALMSAPPDLASATQGFLQGQNDAQDVNVMIWFFLNFKNISYMHDAIQIWTAADRKIAMLASTGNALKLEMGSAHVNRTRLQALRAQLETLNTDLLMLENRFSEVLGQGARWVKTTIWELSFGLLIVIVGTAIWISRNIVRTIAGSERALLVSESRFSSLKISNTIGIVSWQTNGLLDEANDLFLDMLGYSTEDLAAGRMNWRTLTPDEFRKRDEQAIRELQQHGRCEPYEKSFFHKQGQLVPVYLGASMLKGDREHGIAFVIDISERKKAEEALKLAGLVYQSINEAIMVTDADNRILAINPAFTELTGYTLDDVLGKDPKLLRSGRHDKNFYEAMWRSITQHGTWQGEVWNKRKNGEVYVESLSINTIFDPDGSVHRRVALFSDISEQKEAEEIIKQQANYDTLTELPNRRMVMDRLEQQIRKSRREKRTLALLFIDLDGFKEINDQFGHDMGDVLLKEAARRMLSCVRESDTVGRLGGDEFTVILGGLDNLDSVNRITRDILSRLAEPFMLNDIAAHVSASIGISLYPDDAEDVSMLFRNADQAMYAVKRDGRNGYHYYTPANTANS